MVVFTEITKIKIIFPVENQILIKLATYFKQLAVEMYYLTTSSTFVQVIYILCNNGYIIMVFKIL